MVMSQESKEQAKLRSQLEGIEMVEEDESIDTEPRQPLYWKDSTPVRLNALPLNPEMFKGAYEYRSNGSKKNPEGSITITDEEFVKYRIGALLAPISLQVNELIESGSFSDYILESIESFHKFLEDREATQREERKEEILVKARKYCSRYKGMLVAANPQMAKWPEDKLVEWIADNMQV